MGLGHVYCSDSQVGQSTLTQPPLTSWRWRWVKITLNPGMFPHLRRAPAAPPLSLYSPSLVQKGILCRSDLCVGVLCLIVLGSQFWEACSTVFQAGVAPSREPRTLLFLLVSFVWSQKAPGSVAGNALHLILQVDQSTQVELLPTLSGGDINSGARATSSSHSLPPSLVDLFLLFVVQKRFIQPSVCLGSNCSLYSYIFEFAHGKGRAASACAPPSWTS